MAEKVLLGVRPTMGIFVCQVLKRPMHPVAIVTEILKGRVYNEGLNRMYGKSRQSGGGWQAGSHIKTKQVNTHFRNFCDFYRYFFHLYQAVSGSNAKFDGACFFTSTVD
jgi:hypothetical protein